jgi:ribosomal protein S1
MENEWNNIKAKYSIGEYVEGLVIRKFPFGDFIDMGIGFMILLRITEMKDLTPINYHVGNYNPIETKIGGWITDFNDVNHQINISQKIESVPIEKSN